MTTKHSLGALVTEGKTKKVFKIKDGSDLVAVISKDDITAGDGAKHDIIPDKGRLANATTSNVFRLLKACGLPVGFVEQDSETSFVAPNCEMLPYEVVTRREAHGSYLKRNPHFAKGQLFPQLIVEFYLKTKDKNWKGKPLVADDPLMQFTDDGKQIKLFNPAKPLQGQEPFLVLPVSEVFSRDDEAKLFPEMRRIARQAFLVLEKAWQLEGGTLVDLKVEFGYDSKGNAAARRRDRQRFLARARRAAPTSTSRSIATAARSTTWPRNTGASRTSPAISRCRASASSCGAARRRTIPKPSPRRSAILADMMEVVTCSIHKEPVRGAAMLYRMLQEVPDTVVIAFIGRSNGAGPVLSALSAAPVITVPASVKDFPEDVWSSLRAPSSTPVMTVLEPSNAVLAALQILSARNPRLYARVRGEIENRTVNTIPL